MHRQRWVLLATAAAGGHSLTPAQLQKSLFLFGKRMPNVVGSDFYDFQPYHYGPFDSKVYADAEELASQGLMRIVEDPTSRWREYAITSEGEAFARKLNDVDATAKAFLGSIVTWARSCTFQQLVRAIYKEFPEYQVNSVFRG